MISRFTKFQLVLFAIITVLGGAFVGGRYAKIDRLVVDRSFPVTMQLKESGGIFVGAQVTYRGIGVGRVGKMTFHDGGVRARLDIEDSAPKVPADTLAVVADKSAVGEQFVDLQPRVTTGPYLRSGSFISEPNTRLPISTTALLVNVNDLVTSVDTDNLKTVVNELGTAFEGTGEDLGRILDTTSEFIKAADTNVAATKALIHDSDSVLATQIDKQGDLSTFAKNLALLSDTLVDSDPDLRRLLDGGADAAKLLHEVIEENAHNLSALIRNVIATNKPAALNVQGIRALLVLYPYVIEGGYTVVASDGAGNYDAHFGLVITQSPAVCQQGYHNHGEKARTPETLTPDANPDILVNADCTDPSTGVVPRGSSKTTVAKNPAPVAVYDERSGEVTPTPPGTQEPPPQASQAGPRTTPGKDSWTWLLMNPATSQ